MTDHLQPSWWARFSLVGAIFAAVLLVLAPLAYRLGLAGVQGAVLMLPAMATVLAFLAFLLVYLVSCCGLGEGAPPIASTSSSGAP